MHTQAWKINSPKWKPEELLHTKETQGVQPEENITHEYFTVISSLHRSLTRQSSEQTTKSLSRPGWKVPKQNVSLPENAPSPYTLCRSFTIFLTTGMSVLSALFWPSCCVESLLWGRCFVVGAGVGASQGISAFKCARGWPPGGPEDRPSLQKWTSRLDNKNGPASFSLWQPKWTRELSTALKDPPGGPTYVTMDLWSQQTWP